MNRTNDAVITDVYKKLNCGSRNHLRAFIKQLKKNDATYTPQFLSQEKFDNILKESQEKCSKGGQNKDHGKGHGKGGGHGKGRGSGRNNRF